MKILSFLIAITFAISIVSCKPTEKNYKAAYDAALGKREAAKADMDVNLPEGALQQIDGPQLKEVDGKQVYILNMRIRPLDQGIKLPGKYNVAIGSYKMNTNCLAQVDVLKKEGYEAFAVRDSEPMYYSIAGSFETLQEAVQFYEDYKKGKNRVYVGLPNNPVIIFTPR